MNQDTLGAGHLPDVAAPNWRSTWAAVLESAEMDVAETERLLAAFHASKDPSAIELAADWVAPSLLGPIPGQFEDRVRRLLQRQIDVTVEVAEAMTSVRAQIKAMSKLEDAEARPVYLDQSL